MKAKFDWDWLVIGTLCVLLAIFSAASFLWVKSLISTQDTQQSNIPTPIEVQQMLKGTGVNRYDPGLIDGVVGKQTIKAWNNWTFDQYANHGELK